jgi:hypothetical protein
MSGIVENFIRRIEKIVSVRATVPAPGTNHVDDIWLNSDIYPGELSVNLLSGSLYTSDGNAIIDLNKENVILSGLEVTKDSSGVNKLTIQSGSARINGITYVFESSGTDLSLPSNGTSNPKLYFIYGITTEDIYGDGNYLLDFDTSEVTGSTDINGMFYDVSSDVDYPTPPDNSLLLGAVLMYPGATGFDLWPLSVAKLGDYYPKFSVTPSEFLRKTQATTALYNYHQLYVPGQFVIDYLSDTTYLSKKLFVSDYSSISADISTGNLDALAGGGTGGGGGLYTATSLGSGAEVYKTTVGTQFQFRSLLSDGLVTVTQNVNDVTIGLSMSGFVTGITNLDGPIHVYKDMVGTVARFRSFSAGDNVTIVYDDGDNIYISVPEIGTTAQGISLGSTGGMIYAGMSGDDLTFRRIIGGTGMSVTQNTNDLTISTAARNNNGINLTGGSGLLYYGMSGDNLAFRSLTGGSNVSVSTVGNNIVISSTGGTAPVGLNVGYTGSTVGQIYRGLSGSDFKFGSVIPGYGIAVSTLGDNIKIDTTITSGAQGAQGPQGAIGIQGPQGLRGYQGYQGPQGASGTNGTNGAQGRQGFRGPQGDFGPQGVAGADGANAPLTTQRFIDIYDSTGAASIPTTSNRILNFGTTRTNTDSVLYQLGSVSQVLPNGTYIEIAEDGYYSFEFSVTLALSAGAFIKAYLWDYTAGAKVNGSDIWFNTLGVAETITSSGSVILQVSAANRYAIRIESVTGSATTQQYASKFSISQLEIGYGNQGALGPQGPQGVNGPQGLAGPQSALYGPQGPQGLIGATGNINDLTISNIGATAYSISSSDSTLILQFTSNSPITVTIPSGLTPSKRYEGKQLGTGQITFVAGGGVTLNKAATENAKTAEQYSVFAIDWTGSETYMIYGKLELV